MTTIPALPAYMAVIDDAEPPTSAGTFVGEGPLLVMIAVVPVVEAGAV